jgi:hypothetical protein
VAEVLPGQPSCPDCGAGASARAEVCPECGYRFVEGRRPAGRRGGRVLAPAAVGVVALGLAAFVLAGEGDEADPDARVTAPGGPAGPEVLADRLLSGPAVERRLEERFSSLRDDDSASARCSPLEPRPVHAIRWCEIRYPSGSERTVIVLSNPAGRELLIER